MAPVCLLVCRNSRGIDFVFHQRSQLRSHCFIAIEAIEWFKEHVEGIHTSEEAVQLGQVGRDRKGGTGRVGWSRRGGAGWRGGVSRAQFGMT